MFFRCYKFISMTSRLLATRRRLIVPCMSGLTAFSAVSENFKHSPLPASSDAKENLRFACLLNVNAALTLLNTSMFLIESLAERYKRILVSLTGLMDECILLDGWNEELWEMIVNLRQEMNTLKIELTNLTVYMESVNKVVDAAIEATFNVDAENLCTTLCQNNHLVQERLSNLKKEIDKSEKEYLLVQEKVIKYKNKIEDD